MKTNLYLDVNLKVKMRKDMNLKLGQNYTGILRHDVPIEGVGSLDEHFTFVESFPMNFALRKRNPHVFIGKFITVTRRDDGSYRPNFRPMNIDGDFSIDGYALGVCNEIRKALKGLVEK